jgi:hypothetical protein
MKFFIQTLKKIDVLAVVMVIIMLKRYEIP